MAKYKCSVCGANSEKEQCWKHLKRKPLQSSSRLKAKKKTAEEIQQDREDKDKMWALFKEVFKERGPYSEIDRTYLGPELRSYMVDHLIEKHIHPELKYEKENLFLVTLDQHSNKTNGHPHPIHQEAIEKAKKRFGII